MNKSGAYIVIKRVIAVRGLRLPKFKASGGLKREIKSCYLD